ncbi:thioredoxin-like protein [Biscogniauxia marginata]|nr:thioredoxin-like protein [Biscogniauxia marginata]
MPGRIECYLDIASFYSYVAFVQLLKNKDLLEQNSVEVELHPVLIAAINVGSGNKPPWSLPAKAAYGRHDMQRAARSVGLKDVSPPGNLMEAGKTMLPMRALLYIKSAYPPAVYTTTFHYLFHAFWTLRQAPTTPSALSAALLSVPKSFPLSPSPSPVSSFPPPSPPPDLLLFTPADVSRVLAAAASLPCKDALKANVDAALSRGAFGAPWLWVTRYGGGGKGKGGGGGGNEAGGDGEGDGKGKGKEGAGEEEEQSEPFFGSDRWHFVYEFLGLPYRDVELLAPGAAKTGARL